MEHVSKCDYRSDLTKPKVDTDLFMIFNKTTDSACYRCDKLGFETVGFWQFFRKPKHSRMDFGRICICCVLFFTARAMHKRGLCCHSVYVCPSVCHVRELRQNE